MARVLILRHGAIGDVIQSLGPIEAIRKHHPDALITLLTTKTFKEFGNSCPWVDDVWIDERPKWWQLNSILNLSRQLRSGNFDHVYDLQTSNRSTSYFRLFDRTSRPEWCGLVKGDANYHANPNRNFLHTFERQRDQLRFAGIYDVPGPDLSWWTSNIEHLNLPNSFILLATGGSPHRTTKRWPVEHYIELIKLIAHTEIIPILIGSTEEKKLGEEIADSCPSSVLNLTGSTKLADIASIARLARCAIGNDTGPMHITATVGCPSLVLFSKASNPDLCAPRGSSVHIIQKRNSKDIYPQRVWNKAKEILRDSFN